MLEIFATVFAAASGGGVMGLLGGLARQALDYFHKRNEASAELDLLKERNAHELALRDKDISLMEAEAKSQFKLAEEQGNAAIETARMTAIATSFAADKATFATGIEAANSRAFIFVDFVRGMIRPSITLLFDIAMLAIWGVLIWLLSDLLLNLLAAKDPATTKLMFDLLIEVTKSIIFLATTATSYWFVARTGGGAPK